MCKRHKGQVGCGGEEGRRENYLRWILGQRTGSTGRKTLSVESVSTSAGVKIKIKYHRK